MKTYLRTYEQRPDEQGYILAAALFAVAMLLLSLSVAIPKVIRDIQRDRELETIHRGQEYVRAIQLYYRTFHTYPPSVDALVSTDNIRFLRQRYNDPLTGKNDWKPIMLGQNKAPTAMGFFGVPLGVAGASGSGTGAGGTRKAQGDSPDEADETSPGTDQSLTQHVGTSMTENTGDGASSSDGSSSPAEPGSSGPVFGGGGIIGFSPVGAKESIIVYKTKGRYNQWEFVYDPLADLTLRGLLPMPPPSSPPTNTGSPGFNPGSAATNPQATSSTDPTGIP